MYYDYKLYRSTRVLVYRRMRVTRKNLSNNLLNNMIEIGFGTLFSCGVITGAQEQDWDIPESCNLLF